MQAQSLKSLMKSCVALGRDCGLPEPKEPDNYQYVCKLISEVRAYVVRCRTMQEQYRKLEQLLQKQETELRKRIGVEQQLRLYTDALRIQVEELEQEKAELLQNSKEMIRELKKSNQEMYGKLNGHTPKKRVTSHAQHSSKHRSNQRESLRDIVKTEYIERSPSKAKKKLNNELPSKRQDVDIHVKKMKKKLGTNKVLRQRNTQMHSFSLLDFMGNKMKVRTSPWKKGQSVRYRSRRQKTKHNESVQSEAAKQTF